MNSIFKKRIKQAVLTTIGWGLPLIGLAQGGVPNPNANNGVIKNPLQTSSITGVLVLIVQWLLGMVGILALLALIVGGIRYILSFGRDQNVGDAKKIITWAIVGLIVVMLSFAIIQIVAKDVLQVKGIN